MENINKIIKEIEKDHRISFKGVSKETIIFLEKEMELVFHGDYEKFLHEYGSVFVSDCRLIGYSEDPLFQSSRGMVTTETYYFRNKFINNKNITVLENDEDEWYVLIDHNTGKLYSFDAIKAMYHFKGDDYSELLVPLKESFWEYVERFFDPFIEE